MHEAKEWAAHCTFTMCGLNLSSISVQHLFLPVTRAAPCEPSSGTPTSVMKLIKDPNLERGPPPGPSSEWFLLVLVLLCTPGCSPFPEFDLGLFIEQGL